eukprot:2931622-Pyramimonas_sp.AAC.1
MSASVMLGPRDTCKRVQFEVVKVRHPNVSIINNPAVKDLGCDSLRVGGATFTAFDILDTTNTHVRSTTRNTEV